MIVQNILTKKNHEIDVNTWETIVAKGANIKYKIVQAADRIETPADLARVDFEAIVKTANLLFKEGKFAEAKTEFEKAKEIRETPAIIRKLDEIETMLNAAPGQD
jgi:hypothetical protein